MKREDVTPDVERRFWENTLKTDNPKECWLWKKKLCNGYGRIHVDISGKGDRNIPAPRIAWVIKYGTIAPDLCVCHACDNRQCVNPNHLWLGTKGHNSEDMWRKGRRANVKTGPPKGTKRSASVKKKMRDSWTPERRKRFSEQIRAGWTPERRERARRRASEQLKELWSNTKALRAAQQDGYVAKGNTLRGYKLLEQRSGSL